MMTHDMQYKLQQSMPEFWLMAQSGCHLLWSATAAACLIAAQALPDPAHGAAQELAEEPDPQQLKRSRAQLPIALEDRPGHNSWEGHS